LDIGGGVFEVGGPASTEEVSIASIIAHFIMGNPFVFSG
jgi:hypothetical protein